MEQMLDENRAVLTGRVLSEPAFSHKTYGESFYMVTMGIVRKSGYEDMIPLMISERLICSMDLEQGSEIAVVGQIRTYNQQIDGRNRLMIVLFVKELEWVSDRFDGETAESKGEAPMINTVYLEGFVCKKPVRRTSPLGREICDIMLAVNRMYNKSDYIPCIAWGRNAVYGGDLEVGTKLYIEGRLQSRQYKKYDDEGAVNVRTAYEVSIMRVEECE